MLEIWKITHLVGPTKRDTILEYTNCTKLKELYQDLFPKIVNEDEEKGKGDDRCVLIEVTDVEECEIKDGGLGNLSELCDLICPEQDAWITPRCKSVYGELLWAGAKVICSAFGDGESTYGLARRRRSSRRDVESERKRSRNRRGGGETERLCSSYLGSSGRWI